ncbi:MAG TPA: hypothetical protein PLR72_03745 [Paludibacteraceae bacterium]|nr:hypothetical protein [Paludibacteraceae bacterium]
MPYRRLPNTDQARLKALKTALEKLENQNFTHQIVPFKTVHEAKSFLNIFETQLLQYRNALHNQTTASKQYQKNMATARLYISHFIQVLNLAVVRGEIKKEQKQLYQLNPDSENVPALNSEKALLHWGKCIIEGENERVRAGGFPIYNPSIAKVKVYYDIFKDNKLNQKFYQETTRRNWEELVALRPQADRLIVEIWDHVEAAFKEEKPFTRYQKCKEYGLIYYYRKGEEKLTPDEES